MQASQSGSFFALFEDTSATGGNFYAASAAAIACPVAAALKLRVGNYLIDGEQILSRTQVCPSLDLDHPSRLRKG